MHIFLNGQVFSNKKIGNFMLSL